MKINGHKVKRIKAINLDDIEGIKETNLNPVAMFEHIDEIEEVLLLAVINGSAEEFDYKGYHVDANGFRHLSALATSELLGKLGFDDDMFKNFLIDVKSDNIDLFSKYWDKFGYLVKKEGKQDEK